MFIKLDSLNSGLKDEILIDEDVSFDKGMYEKANIIDIKNTTFKGRIYINVEEELMLEGTLKGTMTLEDSISLDKIDHNFSINIEEILENDKNTIDIIDILWQNIVLEVPLKITKVKDFSSYRGDGWKLISEEEVGGNNPFLELSEKYKKE